MAVGGSPRTSPVVKGAEWSGEAGDRQKGCCPGTKGGEQSQRLERAQEDEGRVSHWCCSLGQWTRDQEARCQWARKRGYRRAYVKCHSRLFGYKQEQIALQKGGFASPGNVKAPYNLRHPHGISSIRGCQKRKALAVAHLA